MKKSFMLKRFSVYFNGLLYALFDNEEEARAFVAERWYQPVAQIWDNQIHDYIYTEVRI